MGKRKTNLSPKKNKKKKSSTLFFGFEFGENKIFQKIANRREKREAWLFLSGKSKVQIPVFL